MPYKTFQDDQDTTLTGQTPEGILYELHPAGPIARSGALIMDTLILWTLLLVLAISLSAFFNDSGNWLYLLIYFALFWFYHTFFEVFFNGTSPGKRLFRIQVIMEDGTPIRPSASFLRNILRAGDAFLFLYLLGFTVHILSPGFRRLGDWAAGTLVVYPDRDLAQSSTRSREWLDNRPPAKASRALQEEERIIVIRFCERYPYLTPERAHEIARPLAARFSTEDSSQQFAADYLLALGAPYFRSGSKGS